MIGARYYDVTAGRFISRDTDLSQLPDVYCDGDSIKLVDSGGDRAIVGSPALVVNPSYQGSIVKTVAEKIEGVWEFAKSWFDWGGSDLIGETGEGAGGIVAKPLEGAAAVNEIHEEEEILHGPAVQGGLQMQGVSAGVPTSELKDIYPGRYP